MRLWSLHPKYLDRAGLIALWRESLLAQKVLRGGTKGYRRHPQLERFRNRRNPKAAIASYLLEVWKESGRRGYSFDRGRIATFSRGGRIPVTRGQLAYESALLLRKLRKRDPAAYARLAHAKGVACNPTFRAVSGGIETWEKAV